MIKVGTGRSKNPNPFAAGQEAAKEAVSKIQGGEPSVVLAFSSISLDQKQTLEGINSICPGIPLTGGTTGWGTIINEGPGEKDVVVAALQFEKTKTAVVSARGMLKDSRKAGLAFGEELLKAGNGNPPKLAFVFNAVIGANPDLFIQGLKEKIGTHTAVVGGGIGDDMEAKSSGFQYYNDQISQDSSCGLGLWGDFDFSIEAAHGWESIGLPERVTKSKGNVILEIDGRPAINIYEKYFDKSAQELAKESLVKIGYGYPLGIIPDKKGEKIIVRQVVDSQNGSIIAAGNVPEGSNVCIMYADAEKMIEIAHGVAKKALLQLEGGAPDVAFIWDCVCRKTLSMPDNKREIDAISEVIGKEVPVFGFYTFGEWGMNPKEDWTVLNETISLTLLRE